MKNNFKLLGIAAVIVVFLIMATACGDSGGGNENETNTYSVTFNSNGGTDVPAITGIESGSTITLPGNPTKADNDFDGWFIDDVTFQNEFTSSTVITSNLTVYAKWSPYVAEIKIYILTDKFYWVNGVKVNLPTEVEYISDLTVYNGNVYLSGEYMDGLDIKGCYWVNGTKYDLPDSTNINIGSISVYNDQVYVFAGKQNFYWLNGTKVNVPTGASINDLTVYNGSVYLAGAYEEGGDTRACYWVDGAKYELPEGENKFLSHISVYNDQIYVFDGKENFYWINNVKVNFPTEADYIDDLTVYDGSVYLAGSYIEGMNTKACYWVDGVKYDLPDSTNKYILAIAVE